MDEVRKLTDFIGKPDCSKRVRFSKRKIPLAVRRDWCPWCQSILKGTDGCPVLKALGAS